MITLYSVCIYIYTNTTVYSTDHYIVSGFPPIFEVNMNIIIASNGYRHSIGIQWALNPDWERPHLIRFEH